MARGTGVGGSVDGGQKGISSSSPAAGAVDSEGLSWPLL